MSADRTILARTLYDGTGAGPLQDQLVRCVGGMVTDVTAFRKGTPTAGLEERAILTPGLIDMQINGAGDVQFNDTPNVAGIATMAQAAAQGGTAWILPTFITADGTAYHQAIEAALQAIAANVPGVLGLHLEGPFLNPNRPGIHKAQAIRAVGDKDLAQLSAPFPGPLLVTLAPEVTDINVIAQLSHAGVRVFAGHSDATFEDIAKATDHGLKGATHLFNAMTQMTGRAPGLVGAVLNMPQLYAGIIADGHHVHWANVALAARMMPDRLCLVTDAMCTLAGTRDAFMLDGHQIYLSEGRLTNAAGTLAGAHIAMDKALRNMIEHAGTGPALAVRMASSNPAAALGVSDTHGRIAVGQTAVFTAFDENWSATAVLR